MKIVSDKGEILDAAVSLQEIDGVFGLVLESRGGAIGKPNARNTDYLSALDNILERAKVRGCTSIQIYIVSSNALKIWSMNDRQIEVDGSKNISLNSGDLKSLRGKISKAQQDKKENRKSRGGNPTKRILIATSLDTASWKELALGSKEYSEPISESEISAPSEEFTPLDAEKEKEKSVRLIALRRGQPKFRKALLKAYRHTCAVTGTQITEILEAAHIVPYMGEKTNHIANGLLLRADIHTLFDLGLLGISSSYNVVISRKLSGSAYEKYDGCRIKLPKLEKERPSLAALRTRPLPRSLDS